MLATRKDARFWDRIAPRYAKMKVGDAAGFERTLAATAARLAPDHRVLEIGCGTATTALRLAPGVARYVASDVSAAMIAIGREKARAAGCAHIELVEGTAEDLAGNSAAPEGGFDAVLAFNVLHLVADRPATLARLRGLLAPGGLLISKTPCLGEMNPVFRLVVPALRLVRMAPRTVAFVTAAALEEEMRDAGFEIVERARHGSKPKDPRVYLVARRP
ncbi:class I SAM-dependent methyltransferase [Salinarimonas rosea]|uniref:class I SAM-dependent methyltransferase n=1 Tax=Salinarimonas rosea TaxID=552063 RepID=UPI00048B7AFE|nr:class I SAM-dependent methyltransferase [Salinarimonas rosea]